MTTADPNTVAVLGLGAMGLPMARQLANTCTVRGFDPNEERRAAVSSVGTSCASAREAATGADIVLLAVRNAAQLEQALWGAGGGGGGGGVPQPRKIVCGSPPLTVGNRRRPGGGRPAPRAAAAAGRRP